MTRGPRALLHVLVACLLYAAFDSGAVALPAAGRVELALLAITAVVCAAWLYGTSFALSAPLAAWAGVGLLGAFAVWAGASIAWSVAPDRSWADLNRAIALTLTLVLGIAVGSSLPRASARACAGIALAGVVVALYALGGKTVPGISVGGLLDLDHAGEVNRLRAPLGSFHALGGVCVLTALACLGLAAGAGGRLAGRLLALGGLTVALVVLGLTYSRGGVVALVAGLGVVLVLSREPLRLLAALAVALLAAAGPLVVALSRGDLTMDGLALARREDDAAVVGLVLLGALALACVAGWALIALERRWASALAHERPAGRVLAGLAVIALVGLALGVAASERGLRGTLSHAEERFKRLPADSATDPERMRSIASGDRWALWTEAAGAWSDRPARGWGAGSFVVTHRLYRIDGRDARRPGSVPLQWLAETGLIGFALAAGGLLALLAAAVARVRSLPPGPARLAGAALAGMAAAWLVHSLYGSDWDVPGATLPALLALGVVVARPGGMPTAATGSGVARAGGVPNAATGFGAGGPPAGGGRPGARGAGRGIAYATVLCVLLAAAVSAALPALADSRADAAREELAAARTDPGRLASAAARAEYAARLNPVGVEPLFATATVAQRIGDLGQARRQIVRAIERQPESASAWARLLRIELALGDREALARTAERLLELDPRGPASIALAGRAQAALTPPQDSPTATGSPLPQPVPAAPVVPLPSLPVPAPND